jgi:predicted membrane protein
MFIFNLLMLIIVLLSMPLLFLAMIAVCIVGTIYLVKTVLGKKFQETEHHTLQASEQHLTLQVKGSHGSIKIYGWDKDEIAITVTKYGTERTLRQSRIIINKLPQQSGSATLHIGTESTSSWPPLVVSYRIHAPHHAVIQAESSNGELRAEGFQHSVRLSTSNGSVKTDSCKNVFAHTSNGSITVLHTHGETALKTSNGSITLEQVMLDDENTIQAITSNGSITATLPMNTSAQVTLRSHNGQVKSELPLTHMQVRENKELVGRVGDQLDASARIELTTDNGSVTLKGEHYARTKI